MSGSEVMDNRLRVGGPIICPGHLRPVRDCTYSKVTEYGYFIASASLDCKAMLLEGPTGDWIGTFMGHKGALWSARLNDDATLCVTASGDFTAKIWDAISGDCVRTFIHKHIVKIAIFSKDSKTLYTGGTEAKLRIFSLDDPEEEPRILEGHTESISFLCLTPDPNLIVSGANGEENLRVWDVSKGEVVRTLKASGAVTGASLSHDETCISVTCGKAVLMWDSTTFELIKTFELPRSLTCVAYHPETGKFITGSDELWVRAYDFETGKEVACNKGHHGPVHSVAFSPDGSQYASGSEDGTIRIWEWGQSTPTIREPSTPTIHEDDDEPSA